MSKPIIDKSRFNSAYENIFANGQAPADKVEKINIRMLHPFPDHPFSVTMDARMDALVASIQKTGQQQPIVVRPRFDGEYEIVIGHRRTKACELAGLMDVKAIVKELDDFEAVNWMVDSNIDTREVIVPSEMAKAIKMEYDAFVAKNKGVLSGRLDEHYADFKDMSRNQIRRYLKLNDLIPELLSLVDDGTVPLNSGVGLADLKKSEQVEVYRLAKGCDKKLSMKLVDQLVNMSRRAPLTDNKILDLFTDAKPEKVSPKLVTKEAKKYIPKTVPEDKYDDYVIKALSFYAKHKEKSKEVTV